MQILFRAPCPALQPYIQFYWLLADPANTADRPETVVPDGCMELIFHFGAPFQNQKAGTDSYTQPMAFLGGQIVSAFEIAPTGPVGMVGVRFQPWGAYHLLGLPMDKVADLTVDAQDLWGSQATHLAEMVNETPGHQKKMDMIERLLLGSLPRIQESSDQVRHGIDLITNERGHTSVSSLARQLHMSQRTLHRVFRRQVGLSVKSFTRIVRFQSVLRSVKSGQVSNLTDAAYYGGYFDQAHFIKDFRSFCGVNPGSFFREKRQFLDDAGAGSAIPVSY